MTADSDGQHSAADIIRVAQALIDYPDQLILGSREFKRENTPFQSYFGNVLTAKLFRLVTGRTIRDTQTGLRGIPLCFFKDCLNMRENRFDYEMRMLMNKHCPVVHEVAISTIYDSKCHHQTHFGPFKDSLKIYRILLGQFIRYTLSSLSSSVIDLGLFTLFCAILKNKASYVALSTVLARLLSASYNYLINKNVVYKSHQTYARSSLRYLILAICQMLASAFLTSVGAIAFSFISVTIIKIIVDSCLFLVSYQLQKKFVFS